jgi:hypothetical protein
MEERAQHMCCVLKGVDTIFGASTLERGVNLGIRNEGVVPMGRLRERVRTPIVICRLLLLSTKGSEHQLTYD